MPSNNPAGAFSKKAAIGGWAMSALPALMLLASGVMKLARPPEVVDGFAKLGWGEDLALGIGVLEIVCTVIYLVPRTSVLGAILLTGYLGGAIAAHVRIGNGFDEFVMPVMLGVLVWGGIFVRDSRLRVLLPLQSPL